MSLFIDLYQDGKQTFRSLKREAKTSNIHVSVDLLDERIYVVYVEVPTYPVCKGCVLCAPGKPLLNETV